MIEVLKGRGIIMATEMDTLTQVLRSAFGKISDIIRCIFEHEAISQLRRKDDEFIEKNFKPSVDELKWHLIKEQLCDQLDIKVEQADVMETAKEVAQMQFAQYGMANVPEDLLENYAKEMLKQEKTREALINRAVDVKLIQAIKAAITLNEEKVSVEDFNKKVSENA